MTDPLAWCVEALGDLEAAGLRRRPVTVGSAPGPEIEIGGCRVLQFCSNDYLGLAPDPRLAHAAKDAAARWGSGAGASPFS